MTIFKLIRLVTKDQPDLFNEDRFSASMQEVLGDNDSDDFLTYWVIFNYKYPISESNYFADVFKNQNTLRGRIGVLSRHLIKVAKQNHVNQFLIDEYCQYKKDRDSYNKRYNRYANRLQNMKDMRKFFDEDGNLKLNMYTNHIDQHSSMKAHKNIYKHKLNRLTFELIERVLGS